MYGLSYTRAHAMAFRAAVAFARAARTIAPSVVKRGSSRRSYELVARTEKWRIEHGKPTPQVRT
jgi:hypothetical protein